MQHLASLLLNSATLAENVGGGGRRGGGMGEAPLDRHDMVLQNRLLQVAPSKGDHLYATAPSSTSSYLSSYSTKRTSSRPALREDKENRGAAAAAMGGNLPPGASYHHYLQQHRAGASAGRLFDDSPVKQAPRYVASPSKTSSTTHPRPAPSPARQKLMQQQGKPTAGGEGGGVRAPSPRSWR